MDNTPKAEIINNVTEITVDIGENIIDSFLNDGLLKDIPILGFGINVVKLTTNVCDLILLSKLKLFIKNLNIIDQKK